MIKNGETSLIVNTTEGKQAIEDSAEIRYAALQNKVAYTTTISGAEALCMAMLKRGETGVSTLRELHKSVS
jgi:carbamoyl-phosphate synthase large subunit